MHRIQEFSHEFNMILFQLNFAGIQTELGRIVNSLLP